MRINEIKEFGATVLHIETEHMSIGTVLPEGETVEETVNMALTKSYYKMLSAEIDNPVERIFYGLDHIAEEAASVSVTVYKPSVKSIKTFVAAIWSVITSGKMDEIDEYEKNICPLPKEIKDYIKELINE